MLKILKNVFLKYSDLLYLLFYDTGMHSNNNIDWHHNSYILFYVQGSDKKSIISKNDAS